MAGGRSSGTPLQGIDPLAARLAERGPEPVYLLLGDDRRSIDVAVSVIEEACVPEDLASFNRARLRGTDSSMEDVLNACATFPMLGDRRCVVVREPERLTGEAEDLARYVREPCLTTTLVLVPASLDRRTRVAQALLGGSCVVAFEAPSGRDLEAWCARALAQHELRLEPGAKDLLADLVQADTLILGHELDKLALYCAGRGTVTREDVLAVLGRTRTIDVWDLTNSLEDADPAGALLALRRLREQGSAVPLLVGMLDWCLGRLLSSEEPKAPPGRRRAIEARRRALRGRGAEVYELLRAVDRAFRTTGGQAEAALERLVLAACR